MILIVEDYANTARAMCMLLKMRGCQCEWKTNGHEAITYIRQHPAEQPLLVLSDEMMPVMTGTQMLEQLRADPQTAKVPVIIYSAQYDSARQDEAIALGVCAYLHKGAEPDGVLRTVCEWYDRIGGVRSTVPNAN